MPRRVDDIAWPFKPLFWAYGYGLGLLYHLYFRLVRYSSRIQYSDPSGSQRHGNFIYCLWHQDCLIYSCVFLRHERHTWISHPTWKTKPLHVCMRLAGVGKVILGSTGNNGREAADQLVTALCSGDSTVISPDGPAGPAKVLKKGVFHVAAKSSVPIVPLVLEPSRYWRLGSWDRKRLPLPFSKIGVRFGTPVRVTQARMDSAMEEVLNGLNGSIDLAD